jgi:hypothetical protein
LSLPPAVPVVLPTLLKLELKLTLAQWWHRLDAAWTLPTLLS